MPVDMSGSFGSAINARLADAKKLEKAKNLDQAATVYRQAAYLMRQFADIAPLEDVRKSRLARVEHLLSLADSLDQNEQAPRTAIRRTANTSVGENTRSVRPSASGPAPAPPRDSADANEDFESQIDQLITRASVSWDDIAGLEETQQEIKMTYGLEFVQKPLGVDIRGWRKILLYGPPGTGKTLLASATSNHLDATFYSVRLDSLLSKWFGESSKIVHALFESAASHAPSVVFIDELDSVAGKRGGEQSSADLKLVNTFLTELDGFKDKDEDPFVLIMAATNRPWDLDDAIISRFEKRIAVPLPDLEARKGIIDIHLKKTGFQNKVSLDALGQMTEGYSGRELDQIIRGLVMNIVTEMNPDLADLADLGPQALSKEMLQLRPIKLPDWEGVLERTPAKTTQEVMNRLKDWGGK
jgi:SpoVK/Ycf46/Vps4 family AAA+-type ATPase